MVFSQKNPPSGFYHYLYLREDGSPYYSGKGVGTRAWKKRKGEIHPPRDHSRIVITHWNLTALWAFAMERWHIRWYGRKDLGTGILRNMTDGGEGLDGIIRTKKWAENIGKSLTGITRSSKSCSLTQITKKINGTHPSEKNIIDKTNNTKKIRNTHPSNPTIQEKRQQTMLKNNTSPDSVDVKRKRKETMEKNQSFNFRKNNPNDVKMVCPHCLKIVGKPSFSRWHGDNCKVNRALFS